MTLSCLYYYLQLYEGRNERSRMVTQLTPHTFCPPPQGARTGEDDLTYWVGREKSSRRVLAVSSHNPHSVRGLLDFLASVRIKYKVAHGISKLQEMVKSSKGRLAKYSVIIFQDVRDLYGLEESDRLEIEDACKSLHVGIVGFIPSTGDSLAFSSWVNRTSLLHLHSPSLLSSLRTTSSDILRLLKANLSISSSLSYEDWRYFDNLEPGSEVLLTGLAEDKPLPLVVSLPGQRVLLGCDLSLLSLWFLKLLLLDVVAFLSKETLALPLTRYILVDIDDIFVGSARLLPSDVDAMVSSQIRLEKYIPGFRYNLGFSGKYFQNGSPSENMGDSLLISWRDSFWWFPHMWKHLQPHRFSNSSELEERMELNKRFAASHSLPVEQSYSVAPHHSGVYPVHSQLYTAWRRVWGVNVTSTEEYPNLRPARRRRGFIHQGVSVLPRQTCGLFTKNTHIHDYPGGRVRLEESIRGGELFMTVVTNPISVFMTHMPNYCCDRLAPYTWESLASFVTCNTNLELRTRPPQTLANSYFSLFPSEKLPLWTSPCEDPRHREIWAEHKSCHKLPNFLIIGPQKTGTTALSTFLALHPNLVANKPSTETFEEVQFFKGDQNYLKGIDWYMDFFEPSNGSLLFEKSANYFDGDSVPLRANKLLPDAKLISVLIPPESRAYSWYQHMRAHSDPAAMGHTFSQVLAATPGADKALLSLQSRCLSPGKYSMHLEHWLALYPASQLHIVDGEALKKQPVPVLDNIQSFLNLTRVDFSSLLVWDSSKGFYCMNFGGRRKCLGRGKGRQYAPMVEEDRQWLSSYYLKYNRDLIKLLTKHDLDMPSWLQPTNRA